MEHEYAYEDTLSTGAVAAMYTTYTMHAAALTWASVRRIWPVPLPARPARIAGTVLAAVGGTIALAGARPFGAGAQLSGIDPGSLYTSGVYRYSRNPQYLGLGLATTGIAAAARSGLAGLIAGGVVAAYRRWIPSEERHLARVFGSEYEGYRASVRRWLGTYPSR